MTLGKAIAWILGAAVAIAGICAISVYIGNRCETGKYDERQKAARDEGYRIAFYVGVVYYTYVLLNLMGKNYLEVEPYLLLLFGLLAQILTVHIYALMKDSALPLGEKPGGMAVSYAVCALSQFLRMSRHYTDVPGWPLMGYGSDKWFYLSTGSLFFLLALAHLISILRQKKEEEE